MTTTPVILEQLAKVAPLGVRFRDEVSQKFISAGLQLTAHRPARPNRHYALIENRFNTFILQQVWQAVEFGAGDDAYWHTLPPAQDFIIEVTDTTAQFLSFAFTAAVPQRDLYPWTCGSPLDHTAAIPLFSAPTRSIPGGHGVIRADVRDAAQLDARTGEYAPAAYALLEAWYDGTRIGRGVADRNGRVVVPFPYPEPINPPLSSPPGPRTPLTKQQWPIELRAFYTAQSPVPRLPDLCTVLSQAAATVLSALSPPAPLTLVTVDYGLDCFVKTTGRSDVLIS